MRNNHLRMLSESPYNAEPPCLVELTKHAITPMRLMYARNHSDVVNFEEAPGSFELKIEGEIEGMTEVSFAFRDLIANFPRKEVVATLICAGNRRAKMSEKTQKKVEGIKWGEGAISNVRWGGVLLRDLLLQLGVPANGNQENMHVCFASHVAPCEQDTYYGGSIPLEKAMDEEGDVLLAYEMNGQPLTPGHGFPLRVVVPGYSGMRWVKWVDRITISRRESTNFYQQRDYKMLPECVTSRDIADSQDWWDRVPAMQALPLNSVVAKVECFSQSTPSSEENPAVRASGYAYSHSRISHVEISADGGLSWAPAKITYQEGRWSWSLWEGAVEVAPVRSGLGEKRGITVMSRAYDESGRLQNTECAWNLRGVGFCGAGEGTIEL
ncbi:hypothetical protein BV22DRAFT_1005125 [Leucogyrophana mollusca]|uniref:Uncharacterized protein n=1 Tax=Leucogyrophana mollusca TaxID=85980 RepID=A0ACB8BU52_9AGAM|nr:hypothetical protein BV22DRAFT_1005125 [Leucogyrophana mollusca]